MFGLFSSPVLEMKPILDSILRTPPDLAELSMRHEEAILYRVTGHYGYNIHLVTYDQMKSMPWRQDMPFIVIHSDQNTFEWTLSWIANAKQPILHVSDVKHKNVIERTRFNRPALHQFAHDVEPYVANTASSEDIALLRMLLSRSSSGDPGTISNIAPYSHTADLPNELAILSMNYQLPSRPRLKMLNHYGGKRNH
jgi:hypothetical protein